MYSRQKGLFNSHRLRQHLKNRRDAVGGAARIGNHTALLGTLVPLRIDAVYKFRRVRAGRRDEDALGPPVGNVHLGSLSGCKFARAFEHVVDAGAGPVEVLQVPLGGEHDVLAVDGNRVAGEAVDPERRLSVPQGRVVADEVYKVIGRRARVVDGGDSDVVVRQGGAEGIAACPMLALYSCTNDSVYHDSTYAPKSIDSNDARPYRGDAFNSITAQGSHCSVGDMLMSTNVAEPTASMPAILSLSHSPF